MANQQEQQKEQTLSQENLSHLEDNLLEDVTGGGIRDFLPSCFKPRTKYEDPYAEQHYYMQEQAAKQRN
jgi:hypothetical protein